MTQLSCYCHRPAATHKGFNTGRHTEHTSVLIYWASGNSLHTVLSTLLILFSFLFVYLRLSKRERAGAGESGRGGGRSRPSLKQVHPRTPRSQPQLKADAPLTEPPGSPCTLHILVVGLALTPAVAPGRCAQVSATLAAATRTWSAETHT